MEKESMQESRGRFVVNHPWWVLFLSLLFVGAAGSGIQGLEFTNNYRVFFGEDNPQLLAFDTLQSTYSKSDNVMLLVEPADGQPDVVT